MTFFARDVAGGGTAAVNKSGYSVTVLCGSTAAGDPFPVHLLSTQDHGTDQSRTKAVIVQIGLATARAG
jgi:hypothetical protein